MGKASLFRRWYFWAGAVVLAALCAGALCYTGTLWPTRPAAARYPVRGVDVSSYQGEIDWPVLAGQNISFAFIKATEGSGYTDEYFSSNWENALGTELRVGAYHFFSYDSAGETQAENFIAAVPRVAGTLPPVVDVEFYGEYDKNPPTREHVRALLAPMLERLEAHYGAKPIIYTTARAHRLFLSGEYTEYPLWIRSVYWEPMGTPDWAFWQYSARDVLSGYNGKEKFIDCNVFRGTAEELDALLMIQ